MKSRLLLLLAFALGANGLIAANHAVQFDPAQSTVDVTVKATIDSFTGKLAAYELTGAADDSGHIVAARLSFHFRDVLTGKPKRDAAMHEWQHTDQFPDASFELTAVTTAADGSSHASGKLTFHGVTRELDFPVTVAHAGATYAIDGEAPIDTREFGLPIIRMMGLLKVDPVVRVRFHFQGKLA
ncbi:MAG: YceI family protein [Candidatus Didemnitutus sp.]|nr:YceI family protein [Candidatus Didemnitutus sp.]